MAFRACLVLVALSGWLAGWCAFAADEATGPTSEPPPKLLVLQNGRMLKGDIIREQFGYRVSTGSSVMFFGFEQVNFTAADVQDAYRKIEKSIPKENAERDLYLGRWCLQNQLLEEAAEHFRKVLKLDGRNAEAKQALKLLDQNAAEEGNARAPVATRAVLGQVGESLGGLSALAVREYVTVIQPVLLARCGSARCHGAEATAQTFRLERVRTGTGSSRVASAKNLEAVLAQIDAEYPSKSELLAKALAAHGGRHQPPFDGLTAAQHSKRLKSWIETAAAEVAARDQSAETVADWGKPARASGEIKQVSAETSKPEPKAAARPTTKKPTQAKQSAPKQKTEDRRKQLVDPFDPADFNNGR